MSGSEIPNALYGVLSSDPPLGALLSVPEAVYPKEAPEGASYPFVLFQQLPGTVVRSFRNIARNQLWLVKGVDRGGDPATVEAIARRCEEVLDDATLPLEGDRRIIGSISLESDLPAHEVDGGELVMHAGGIYRVLWE